MAKLLQNLTIEKIGYGGIGLSSLSNGKKVLIKGGALPGSVVDAVIKKNKKDHIQAHIHAIKSLDPTYADGDIFCPHYFHSAASQEKYPDTPKHKIGCGGCKRQIMSYHKQLELKEAIVAEAMTKIMHTQSVDTLPIVPSPHVTGYRNKIEFSFGKYLSRRDDIQAHWNLGFHKQGEFSKIVDIDSCGLITARANKLFEYMKSLCEQSSLPVYDQKTHQGFFRHLVIREGINTEQFLVNLVVADEQLDETMKQQWDQLITTMQQNTYLQNTITTMQITYNNDLADVVKGKNIHTDILRGEGHMFEKLRFAQENQDSTTDIHFRVSPFSFFQTNTVGAQQLFSHAAQIAGETTGTILDLYCGTGTIGLSFLKLGLGKELVGIEIVADAIIDAQFNANINKLDDVSTFIAAPAEQATKDPELMNKLNDLGLIIVDPPRDGLHKNVINFIAHLHKKHPCNILYISCNPITMARDIELFNTHNITLKTLQPVDMFPHTHHVEVIGLLQ